MGQWIDRTEELLGTQVRIIAFCDGKKDLVKINGAFQECKRIEKSYSRFLENNKLSKLNTSLGKWVKVDREFFDLIQLGEKIYCETWGVFDLAVKGILENWGYDQKYSFVERKGLVFDRKVAESFDLKCGRYVRLYKEIELGAFGKGYAIDQMVKCLIDIDNFSINAGGDIFARGKNFENKTWKILFEHPRNVNQAVGFVEVDNFAVACSSPTKRRWGDKHHLVDAIKGEPANQMLAVYTQAKTALIADAYSTALFVVGFENAKKLISRLEIEAMLVSVKGEIYRSRDFRGKLFLSCP